MFIFQSKFNNPPYRDRITEKSGTKKNQWDFQISRVGSLDFLNLKVNGSPGHFTAVSHLITMFLASGSWVVNQLLLISVFVNLLDLLISGKE